MAEAFLKQMAGDRFEVESAGLEHGMFNPLAVEIMKEVGIDISQNKTKSAFDFYTQGKSYDYVITVCDESQAGRGPVFPGSIKQMHWGFDDPSSFQGTWKINLSKQEKLEPKAKPK
jgi:arsenate reductase (thioredoxin)